MTKFLMKLKDHQTGAIKQISYKDSSVGFTSNDSELDEIVKIINYHLREGAKDNGVAPTGEPDECFYCRVPIGHYHKPTCVLISNNVTYWVYFSKLRLGTFTTTEPISWDVDQSCFHKNESSWCKDNGLEYLVLDENDSAKYAKKQLDKMIEEHFGCACSLLEFTFVGASKWPPNQDRIELLSIEEMKERE